MELVTNGQQIRTNWADITASNEIIDGDDAKYHSAALEAAEKEFGEHTGSHKIVFWSDQYYRMGDFLRMRINGKVLTGRVSSVRKSSDNDRFQYTTGDMATTLTEKIKKKG